MRKPHLCFYEIMNLLFVFRHDPLFIRPGKHDQWSSLQAGPLSTICHCLEVTTRRLALPLVLCRFVCSQRYILPVCHVTQKSQRNSSKEYHTTCFPVDSQQMSQ